MKRPSACVFGSRVFALLALLCHCSVAATAMVPSLESVPVSQRYTLKVWELDEGLPSGLISGITQTPDGYLWVSTQAGLVRFDGVRFTVLSKETTPGLELNTLSTVFAARNGDLWIGLYQGGVALLHDGTISPIIPTAPLPSYRSYGGPTSFAEDAQGTIWSPSAMGDSLFQWQAGKRTPFTVATPARVTEGSNMVAAKDGTIWLASARGCEIFDGKSYHAFNSDDGGEVRLAASHGGGMWAARGGKLLFYPQNGTREVKADLLWLGTPDLITKIYEDREGNVWIGTRGKGLFQFREGRFERIPTSSNSVSSIFEDREGNVWIGSLAGGLDRLRSTIFTLRQTKDGLHDNDAYSVVEDTENRLWVTGGRGMLDRSIDTSNRSFGPYSEHANDSLAAMALCPDAAGGVWIASLNGLLHWRDGQLSQEALHDQCTALLLDRRGDLWVATTNGPLYRWRKGEIEKIVADNGLVAARALAEDSAGHLWVGTEAGLLFRREDDLFTRVSLPEAKRGEPVRFIVPTENETVWIGTYDGNFYRWHAGKMARLSPNSGLPLNDLRALTVEPDGDFWFGTGRGLFRVDRSQLEAVMSGRKDALDLQSYGRDYGLPNVRFALGFRNATARTRDGRLWFATSGGVLEINPADTPTPAPLLPVLIEEIRGGPVLLPPDAHRGFTLPPRTASVEIHYTLPESMAFEKMGFRYRLLGLGDEWTFSQGQRSATFSHLAPGEYQFEVAACRADGSPLTGPTRIAFAVSPTWWQMAAFRVSVAAAGVTGLGFLGRRLVRWRITAGLRAMEREHALERERIRISHDMHDQLGASLTQIAITSALLKRGSPSEVAVHSDKISLIARRTAESLDEIVWAVDPSNDALPPSFDYLSQFAVDFLSAAGIDCELEMPDELPLRPLGSQVRHGLFLVIKEALNNVVKHAGASHVRLTMEASAHSLHVCIADDGRGFDASALPPAGADGLRNMQRRMQELGGKCRVETTLVKGTRITLELPLVREDGKPLP